MYEITYQQLSCKTLGITLLRTSRIPYDKTSNILLSINPAPTSTLMTLEVSTTYCTQNSYIIDLEFRERLIKEAHTFSCCDVSQFNVQS